MSLPPEVAPERNTIPSPRPYVTPPKIEESIFPFLQLTAQILSDDAVFFLVNSYTTGLQPAVLTYMISSVLSQKFGGRVQSDEIGLPVTESGLILPCGASGRWSRTE